MSRPGLIKTLITFDDNETQDLARVVALSGVVLFFVMAIANGVWNWRNGHLPFNLMEFGTGLGAVMLASGAWIFMSAKSGDSTVAAESK